MNSELNRAATFWEKLTKYVLIRIQELQQPYDKNKQWNTFLIWFDSIVLLVRLDSITLHFDRILCFTHDPAL